MRPFVPTPRKLLRAGWLTLLLLLTGPAMAASMFEDIEVETRPSGTVIRVIFTAPIRYQSHTPEKRGSDLRILLRALSPDDFDPAALLGRETRGWGPGKADPLRSMTYEGVPPASSQLIVEFKHAVDFTVRSTPDLRTLIIEVAAEPRVEAEPVVVAPTAPAEALPTPPSPQLPVVRPAVPLDVQVEKHVVYLTSSKAPISVDTAVRLPAFDGLDLFISEADVRGVRWNRLTLGYFDSLAQARAMVKAIHDTYPSAWVGTAQVTRTIAPIVPAVRLPPTALANGRIAKMMTAGRQAMTTGEYSNAVQIFTAILESAQNEYTREAHELLGLARERNGQLAHAKAEYAQYLQLYPEGKDADRVRQRLAGVLTARPTEQEVAAAEAEQKVVPVQKPVAKRPIAWNWFGSLSQQYFRDETHSASDPALERINVSRLTSWLSLTGRARGTDYDFRSQMNLQQDHDFETLGQANETAFSDFYAQLTHNDSRASVRVGRQRHAGSGTLGRFDGLLLSYPFNDAVTVNAVTGYPVDLNNKSSIDRDGNFFGLSANITPAGSEWNYNAFAITQQREGLLDRQAIGGEVRYFSADKSLFTLVDYDVSYSSLVIFLTQGNWNISDRSTIYATVDYRYSPVLTTRNALLGQTVTTLDELMVSLSEDEIRQLAEDRSARTSTVSLGGSYRFRENYQIAVDVTATKTGSTPASGGVAATEATDLETYYSLQFIGSNIWFSGDTSIVGLRFSDTTTARIYGLTVDTRFPLPLDWRVNPRFLAEFRDQLDSAASSINLKPSLRAEYRGWRNFELEFEGGLDWRNEYDGTAATDLLGYFLSVGYRWDF